MSLSAVKAVEAGPIYHGYCFVLGIPGETIRMKQHTSTLFACLTWGALALSAQDLTITNARIVVANGAVIERGSIVVRAENSFPLRPGRLPPRADGPSTPRA